MFDPWGIVVKNSKQARRVTLALLLTSALVGMAGTAQAKPVKSILAGVSTAPGEIDPLYRNINPFYRNIGAFWGSVNPFYRNIGAFWGDIDPFYRNIGAFWGDLNPLYRNIGAFNGQIVPDYRNIGAFWDEAGGVWTGIDSTWAAAGTFAANPTAYASLAAQLNALSAKSEAYWGASVTSQTGKSFAEGFANPLFAKYGINPNDPASLEKLPANERSHFFMDWYDGLMNFSGTDHADHWMKTVNWTPLLTQTQGSGKGVVIGLVDFHVAGDADLQSKTIYNGGNSTYSNGHGAAVGSLIAAAHDGKGVMGIAPNATIAAYNPFDATGTADWPDIKAGIKGCGCPRERGQPVAWRAGQRARCRLARRIYRSGREATQQFDGVRDRRRQRRHHPDAKRRVQGCLLHRVHRRWLGRSDRRDLRLLEPPGQCLPDPR